MPMRSANKYQWTSPIGGEFRVLQREKNGNGNLSAQVMENVPS